MGFPFDPLTVICTEEMPSFTSLTSILMLEAGVCVTVGCGDDDDCGSVSDVGMLPAVVVLPEQIKAAVDGLSGAVAVISTVVVVLGLLTRTTS